MYFLLEKVDFHCYVSLLEGTILTITSTSPIFFLPRCDAAVFGPKKKSWSSFWGEFLPPSRVSNFHGMSKKQTFGSYGSNFFQVEVGFPESRINKG